MGLYTGIDLHSNNCYFGIRNAEGAKIHHCRKKNEPELILKTLEPYKEDIIAVCVESTFNWYWLVDLLQENGYEVHLANPAAIQQYSGLKDANDKNDAFWLAEMLRLGILPTGYIYNKSERPIRDLLRRRQKVVQQRTSHKLSLKSLFYRNYGEAITAAVLEKADRNYLLGKISDPNITMMADVNIKMITDLKKIILSIEREVTKQVKLRDGYKLLLTIPGIGNILALTIMLEIGDIGRFDRAGNLTSYGRCTTAKKTSNGKKKGKNNSKNGNKYLSWAFIEAASRMIIFSEKARRFYQRKKDKRNPSVAMKSLAAKISKAVFYILRDQVPYNEERVFG